MEKRITLFKNGMHNCIAFLLLLVITPLGISSTAIEIPFQKKVEKVVKKLWKGEEVTISKWKEKSAEKQVFRAFTTDLVGYLIIDEANGCQIGGCDLETKRNVNSTKYETFYYMVVLDPEFIIRKVSILEYTSEHGYEICAKRWLRQFEGLKSSLFSYGEQVDAISGATISGISLVKEIQECMSLICDSNEKH